MEIARAAAGLFVKHGLRATRAEDIAQAAGIAPRTFYRYFATKEESVAPLYAAGAQLWAEAVREAPADLSVPQALEHAVRHTLMPGSAVSAASWEWVRALVRLAAAGPGLGKVWAEVCQAGERTLVEVLAARLTRGDDNVAGRLAASPELRFAAAVASAAVRTAVEAWGKGDAPSGGPEGPAGLALRNLGALGEFPWEALPEG
ncbi:TetR family transcriptional regulator [Streptomyces sp. MMG1533]|uniref:TetR/AcrR family transcriptional regulator n=1 Tax=Streptomyces sp. MMG1533 TaxID=1415546 RepID=UPI0006AFFC81|nr:TetR family transcriptional regulator [Streptomyces sp. MMG1533]